MLLSSHVRSPNFTAAEYFFSNTNPPWGVAGVGKGPSPLEGVATNEVGARGRRPAKRGNASEHCT